MTLTITPFQASLLKEALISKINEYIKSGARHAEVEALRLLYMIEGRDSAGGRHNLLENQTENPDNT